MSKVSHDGKAKKKAGGRGDLLSRRRGPGDLGLVTLKVKEVVEKAEVDRVSTTCAIRDFALAPEGTEIIYAGKKAGQHTLKQRNQCAARGEGWRGEARGAAEGRRSAALRRGAEEALRWRNRGSAFEIIPGVTSAIARRRMRASRSRIATRVAAHDFSPGNEDPTKPGSALDYAQLAKLPGTRVMLMGVERLGTITEALLQHGERADLPVALVRWGPPAGSRPLRGRLGDIAGQGAGDRLRRAGVAVFGDVVRPARSAQLVRAAAALRQAHRDAPAHRAAGRRLARGAERARGRCLQMPTIRIEPPKEMLAFGELVRDAHQYAWLIFTSPNA